MTSFVDDATADQMLLERTTVDFLTRKGGLKLTKGMTQEEKRAAIRQAVENVVHKEKPASGEETASTYIDTDPATHTPEQMERIKEYQAATDNKILAFVKRWTGLKDPNYRKKVRMDVASVDQRTIDDIQALLGIDVSGFTGHSLSGNALGHIERRHGVKGKADYSMANPNDIARVGYVLEHYDSVEPLLDKDGKLVLSKEHHAMDGSHAPMICFKKRVDGTYYVVEAVPDSVAKKFKIISAYIQK